MNNPRQAAHTSSDKLLVTEPIFRGRLGQTLRTPMSVTSEIGRTFTASVYTQVNVTVDPHLRAALMDSSLTTVTDPYTSARYTLAVAVLYHNEALRLLALVLPNSLRHREFTHRQTILEELSRSTDDLPSYVRKFCVVFGPKGLERAEQDAERALRGQGNLEPSQIAQQRRELDERDRRLQEERQQLEALRLNLEDRQHRLQEQEEAQLSDAKSSPPTNPQATPPTAVVRRGDNEPTTVVPREVFYSSLESNKPAAAATTPAAPAWSTGLEQGWEIDEQGNAATQSMSTPPPIPNAALAPRIDAGATQPVPRPGAPVQRSSSNELAAADDLPRTFNRLKAGSRSYYHSMLKGQLLLSHRLPEGRMQRFLQHQPQLFLQFHDLEEFPLITILIAAFDEEENLQDDLYVPLDARKKNDRSVLENLVQNFSLRVALYGEDLKLRQVLSFREPLEVNAQHILQLADHRFANQQGLSYEAALRRIEAPDYERLGTMRHNFHQESFAELPTPKAARLAAGIVGYWSGPETFRYHIENRSFSLEWFSAVQERIVTAATRFGIALSPQLQQIAIDLELAEDEVQLAKNMASTWAQLTVGLGGTTNDLDALDSWENWQDIIEMLENLGESLDEELTDLANAALKRAQDYSKSAAEEGAPATDKIDLAEVASVMPEIFEDPKPPSETPENQPIGPELLNAAPTPVDGMDALEETVDRKLLTLLEDEKERLPAACLLLKRGNADAIPEILFAADEMEDDELEVLSEHLTAAASNLEDALIEGLSLDSSMTAYLCAFALSAIPSEKGLPSILDTFLDEERCPDPLQFSETILAYGVAAADALGKRIADTPDIDEEHPYAEAILGLFELSPQPLQQHIRNTIPAAKPWLS